MGTAGARFREVSEGFSVADFLQRLAAANEAVFLRDDRPFHTAFVRDLKTSRTWAVACL